MTKENKTPQVSLKLVIIELGIILFFTITWLNGLIFSIGFFNIWYFLIMFISLIGFVAITLCSKDNPDQPIPKLLTQKFCNLIKAMTDIINIQINQTPMVNEMKVVIQNALIWGLREAKISPEFDKEILQEAETYMFDNLKREINKND